MKVLGLVDFEKIKKDVSGRLFKKGYNKALLQNM